MNATVVDLEAALYELWSPNEQSMIHGWTARAASGFTRRINSATGVGEPAASPAEYRALVSWYAERSLPLIVRVTPLLDPALARRVQASWGLVSRDPTLVMTKDLAAVEGSTSVEGSIPVDVVDPTTEEFLRLVCARNHRPPTDGPHYRRIMSRLGPRAAGLRVGHDAVGFVAIDGDLSAVFSVAVDPALRRRGLASEIMATAADWATSRGAHRQFLQVEVANVPAVGLYEAIGFSAAYEYSYLEVAAA